MEAMSLIFISMDFFVNSGKLTLDPKLISRASQVYAQYVADDQSYLNVKDTS
jgi:hypothetical protein